MSKIVSGFLALCLTVAVAAGAQAHDMHHGMGMGMGHHKHHCAAGQHWVKGYTNRNGKHVKGYCR